MEVSESTLDAFGISSRLPEGEEVLGFYRGTTHQNSFLITNQSLYLSRNGAVVKINYSDMESCTIPATEKDDANEVWILLKNGAVETMLVEGGELPPKFRLPRVA